MDIPSHLQPPLEHTILLKVDHPRSCADLVVPVLGLTGFHHSEGAPQNDHLCGRVSLRLRPLVQGLLEKDTDRKLQLSLELRRGRGGTDVVALCHRLVVLPERTSGGG